MIRIMCQQICDECKAKRCADCGKKIEGLTAKFDIIWVDEQVKGEHGTWHFGWENWGDWKKDWS